MIGASSVHFIIIASILCSQNLLSRLQEITLQLYIPTDMAGPSAPLVKNRFSASACLSLPCSSVFSQYVRRMDDIHKMFFRLCSY